jgi:DNA-nicking Smr family endonuclease
MARSRRSRRKAAPTVGPALTGIAALLSETPAALLDLHGHTAAQAEARLRDFLRTHATVSTGRVVHVVTGRGSRSEAAPVLPSLVRRLLDEELAGRVAESAGLPGGGGVAVRMR